MALSLSASRWPYTHTLLSLKLDKAAGRIIVNVSAKRSDYRQKNRIFIPTISLTSTSDLKTRLLLVPLAHVIVEAFLICLLYLDQ